MRKQLQIDVEYMPTHALAPFNIHGPHKISAMGESNSLTVAANLTTNEAFAGARRPKIACAIIRLEKAPGHPKLVRNCELPRVSCGLPL